MKNRQGKLFGRLNIIDLIIIAVVILALIFVGYKFMQARSADNGGGPVPVAITFYHEEAADFVLERLEVGSSVVDSNGYVGLGQVTGFEIGDSVSYIETDDGKIKIGTKEGYSSLMLTAVVDGYLGSHGVTVGSTLYGVGHTLAIYAGDAKLYVVIRDIQPAE